MVPLAGIRAAHQAAPEGFARPPGPRRGHGVKKSAALDDGAREARAGVTGRLCLVVVRVGVDDEAAPDDAGRPRRHRDDVEIGLERGVAVQVGLEDGHVAGVALGRARMTVRLAERIEVPLGAHAVARAAVAGLVDVKAVLASRRETGNLRDHKYFVAYLAEGRLAGCIAALGGLQGGGRAGGIGGDTL